MISNRYNRQSILSEVGEEGQKRIHQARVLVIGCGGLGAPVIQYLAGAGVGTLKLVDDDKIHITNLHRQVIFREDQLGLFKSVAAAQFAMNLNSQVEAIAYTERIDISSIQSIAKDVEVIIDCSDNFETRYLVDAWCKRHQIPLVFGAVHQWEGQWSVFHYKQSFGYADAFPVKPDEGSIPNCEVSGVMGSVVGMIGSVMATQALLILTGSQHTAEGSLYHLDALSSQILEMKLQIQEVQKKVIKQKRMKEITAKELKVLMDNKEPFQLIDVREPYEFDEFNLSGTLIPMNDIPNHVSEISRDVKVVVHCKAGMRSANVINYLEQQHGFTNLYNLKGGVLDWIQEFGF